MQYTQHGRSAEFPFTEPDPDVDHHTQSRYDDGQNRVVPQFLTYRWTEVFLCDNIVVALDAKFFIDCIDYFSSVGLIQ